MGMGVVNVNGPGYVWGPWTHNKWGDGTCVREGRSPSGKLVYDLHSIINGDNRYCREEQHKTTDARTEDK